MIGVFDSGSGGLSVLRELLRQLPGQEYLYWSDNAWCPYGERSAEEIIQRAEFITQRLLEGGADIIVVACNTATAAAIATLRKRWSDASDPAVRERSLKASGGRHDHVCFIGMEPAVKPAALGTRSGVIGVLATAGTLKGSKYLTTKGNVDGSIRIVEHVGQGFVELVEACRLDGPEAEKTVRESLEPLIAAGADTIVLGCTHYPFLQPLMEKVAAKIAADGQQIRFIDPAPAVARQLRRVMAAEGLLSPEDEPSGPSKVTLLASGDPTSLQSLYDSLVSGTQPKP